MSTSEKSFSPVSLQLHNLYTINYDLKSEKDSIVHVAQKCQSITKHWVLSHFKTAKIVNDQIPHQYENIIGGSIDEPVDIFKMIESESIFPSQSELLHEYKTKFISGGIINSQDLIDKHCVTKPDGRISSHSVNYY